MRTINKILIWFLVVACVIFITSAAFVALFGKKIIEGQIKEKLKVKTTFKSVSLRIPFSINVSGLDVENLFSADNISFYPDIPQLLRKKIVLHSLNVRGGRYVYRDKKISPAGFPIVIEHINASVSKLELPLTILNTPFKVDADIASPDNQKLGEVYAAGWIDFGTKNMDADLEVKDLEITYFTPYYGKFISERKLLSAKVNLVSKLKAEDNNLKIENKFRLSNLVYAQEEPRETQGFPSLDFTRNALDLFTNKKGVLDLDFALNTKLDKPSISVEQFKKAILDAALRNLANQPPTEVFEKINKTVQQIEDFGKEMKKIFKGGD